MGNIIKAVWNVWSDNDSRCTQPLESYDAEPVSENPERDNDLVNASELIEVSVDAPICEQTPPSNKIQEAADFPFLTDQATIQHIRQSRIMFIMRGLPGSGKTTIVRIITSLYQDTVVCSADDYFLLEDGSYMFDPSLLPMAHKQCQERAQAAAEGGHNVIVIDNTNVRRWEMNFYVELAKKNNYTTVVVNPKTPWSFNPAELALRNKHGVTEEVLTRKVNMFDHIVPLYYGWFLNQQESDALLTLGKECFVQCLYNVPEFKTLWEEMGYQIKNLGMDDIYSREGSSSSNLHCTACFTARGRATGVQSYVFRDEVQQNIGLVSTLAVVGISVTPRTIGARIQLDENQLELWGKDDFEGIETYELEDEEGPFRFCPTYGFGSRAHITLGYAAGNGAVQTGYDLIDIIQSERQALEDPTYIQLDHHAIRYYGNGRCMVYLDTPKAVNAVFSGRF